MKLLSSILLLLLVLCVFFASGENSTDEAGLCSNPDQAEEGADEGTCIGGSVSDDGTIQSTIELDSSMIVESYGNPKVGTRKAQPDDLLAGYTGTSFMQVDTGKATIAVCHNLHTEVQCNDWKMNGECEKNPGYMFFNCAHSCKTCRILEDTKKFGVEQEIIEGPDATDVFNVVKKSIEYYNSDKVQHASPDALQKCYNQHKRCSFWASSGECTKNKAHMDKNCAPACGSC